VLKARAPGKLVALGEYAVLDGAPAVVLAIDRYAQAAVEPRADGLCRLTMRAGADEECAFAPGTASGAALVDLVAAAAPKLAWTAVIDSRAFYSGGAKLGLGSSAAVLVAWAGAFAAFAHARGTGVAPPHVAALIELHRQFQGGRGSGLDVAASFTGGAITFSLARPGRPQSGSVRLPNSGG
jgi:phosphomevalonate kinase